MKEGWAQTKLVNVCTLQRGFDLPKKDRLPGSVPLISSSGAIDNVHQCKVAGPGVVTGRSGSIGGVFFVEEGFWPLNTTLYIKDFHGNDQRFIFYLLKSLDLSRFSSGAGVPTLNRNHVHDETVFVPKSIDEQRRIVTILDEAFAGIDTAITNAEKNLTNTKELFDGYLVTAFKKREGWGEVELGKAVYSVSTGPFGSLLHKSDYISEGTPLINPINIIGEAIAPDQKKKVGTDTLARLSSYILQEGDIVIARRGEIGRCAVIGAVEKGWVCGTGCFFIRPSLQVNPYFLAHMLRSLGYREEMERLSTGATMLNLSNKALSGLKIAFPDTDEQDLIVSYISDLKTQCQSLESIYQQKITVLTELKQSLLQKAFNGELTGSPAASDILAEEAGFAKAAQVLVS